MSHTLLFVVNVDWFFLSHRLPIALAAQRQGYQVHIATGLTDKLDELQRHGLIVHPLTLERSSTGLGNALRTMIELWKVFRSVQPDLVHLVTIKPVLLGGLVARLTGVPAVVAAVRERRFHVWAAHDVSEVLTLLTGTPPEMAQQRVNAKLVRLLRVQRGG